MAATTKMMTASEVVSFATDLAEFDTTLVDRFILPAQRKYIRDFMDEDYYNDTLDAIENSTLDADTSSLLNDYLKPALAYYTMYTALPFLRNEIRSGGIVINSTETSESASPSDVGMLRQAILAMAEQWKHDAEQFIEDEQDDDSSKFPDFNRSQDTNKNKFIFIPYGKGSRQRPVDPDEEDC